MKVTLLERDVSEKPVIVNVSSVPLRSPFRYPGGKTWLVPRVRQWLQRLRCKPAVFVEPFAGGGIISLTVAMEGLAERVVMVERDASVAAVWRVILEGDAEALIRRILTFEMSRNRVVDELAREPDSLEQRAFQTILRNRAQRGGIMAPGASLVKNGERGRGITSRWYPETLAKRIRNITEHRDRIEFVEGDAFEVIPRYSKRATTAFFVDPPYTAGGKSAGSRLYLHNYVDHARLFHLMAQAAGYCMLTYDDAPEPRALAEQYGFVIEEVPMTNTHHAMMVELVITNTLATCVTCQIVGPRNAHVVRHPTTTVKSALKVCEDNGTKKPIRLSHPQADHRARPDHRRVS
jgi:DNA adenine methylase